MFKTSMGRVPSKESGYRLCKTVGNWDVYYKFSYNYFINLKLVENSGLKKEGKCNYWISLNAKTGSFMNNTDFSRFMESFDDDTKTSVLLLVKGMRHKCISYVRTWHIRRFLHLKKKEVL